MIKPIIFDIGGVIKPERGEVVRSAVAEYLQISQEELWKRMREFWPYATRGEMSLRELYIRVVQNLGKNYDPKETCRLHMEAYEKHCLVIDEELLQLIKKLREHYNVVCLTNTEPEVAEVNKAYRYQDGKTVFEHFERTFISCDMNMKKPDAEIYKAVLDACQCLPEEAIFIDDRKEYVDGAKAVGIQGILYQNKAQLEKELKG
jgi:putative hydrolase of the HAD superfamily